MADLLGLLGGGIGAVGGFMLGGPAGAAAGFNIGSGVAGAFGGDDQPSRQPVASRTTGSNRDVANRAFREARDVLSPAYQQSGRNISDLLTEARSQFEPLRKTTFQTQLEDVLSGDTDITQLPGYQAQARSLRNVLASQGLSQSVASTQTAFEPLVASMFGQLTEQAAQERSENRLIAGSLADLFRVEAGTAGMMPIQEATAIQDFGLRSRSLDIDESQFQTELEEGRRKRGAEQEAGALSGLFEIGMEFGPDILDFFTGEGA